MRWSGNLFLPRDIAPSTWNHWSKERGSILEIDDYRQNRQNFNCWARMCNHWSSEPSVYMCMPEGEVDVRMLLDLLEDRFDVALKIIWISAYGGWEDKDAESSSMVLVADDMSIMVRCEGVFMSDVADYRDVPEESVVLYPGTEQKLICVANSASIFVKFAWAHRLAGISEIMPPVERVSPPEPGAPMINIVSYKPAAGFILRTIPMHNWPTLDEDDIAAHYGDDFLVFHDTLLKRLKEDNKGIFLFHGDPGTGKTYYIRRLTWALTQLDKTVVLIPRSVVDRLQDPSFTEFMLSKFSDEMGRKKGAIFLLEDAESVMQDRTTNPGESASVSSLLNLTDGILNDIFPIQVIATFNMSKDRLDRAVLRPGRLGACKHFKTLTVDQARKLAVRIGVDPDQVDRAMALSEVYALRSQGDNDVLIEE